ncbi:thioredoxin family protein [Bergeyella sp. RCAD1439]|uniref:thioredoxin family protein n=1 Tax=Bergeyella anatis TaxID=3113737 RepID=UPI002E1808CE|nr:thioredoxin fold domain-containing protein [Bergeyella sp. RCAD1439]
MIKRISALFALSFTIFCFAQVKWMSIEQALKAQEQEPKKILIDFYSERCAPCKTMELYTYNHPVIAEYLNEHYYAVKFDAHGDKTFQLFGKSFGNSEKNKKGTKGMHDFTRFLNVNAVPSIVFLDEQSMPITLLQGALTAKELEPYIPFFAKDLYKKIQTREQWESYQKKFKSKIKD